MKKPQTAKTATASQKTPGEWYNKIASDAMGKVEHSPLPWQYAYGSIQDKRNIRIILADRNEPGTHPVERDENLKLIVRSVNHATALAEALRDIVELMPDWSMKDLKDKAREALAQWEGAK